ncbi:MAG: hypothetical protein ABI743_02200 [bacterium]
MSHPQRALVALALATLLSGCQHAAADDPAQGSLTPRAPVPDAIGIVEGNQLLVSGWQLQVDPFSATASITPPATRSTASQPPQALSYDLDIAKFLTKQTLRVASVSTLDTGDVVVTIEHQHPFRKPDFTGSISGKNRADLGYTGRLLVLSEISSVDFQGDTLHLDPILVHNAAGYTPVGDLLKATGHVNNVFPYVSLVDESLDNRVGVSNGGSLIGNYTPAAGGWQRGNAGDGDDWTGYDYIHGGQTVHTDVVLDGETLRNDATPIELAILIKYTDPRGVGNKTARFPVEPVNTSFFAYRLPYAAIDVGTCSGCGAVEVAAAPIATNFSVKVRDWDTGATEAADANLSDEADVSLIQPGASARPVVEALSDDLFPSPRAMTYAGGNGQAGKELRFTTTLVNENAAAEGTHWVLIRATDPEANDAAFSNYHFGVDPDTILPSAARALKPITYLPVRVEVSDGQSWARAWGGSSIMLPEDTTVLSNGTILVASQFFDRVKDIEPGLCEILDAPAKGTGLMVLALDVQGNRLGQWIWDSPRHEFPSVLTHDAADNVYLAFSWGDFIGEGGVTTIDLDPGTGVQEASTSGNDVALVKLTNTMQFVWGQSWGAMTKPFAPTTFPSPSMDATAIAIAPGGNLYLSGRWRFGQVDLDPGAGIDLHTNVQNDTNDSFLMSFAPNGSRRWAKVLGGTYYDDIFDLSLNAATEHPIAVGRFSSLLDFDPGPGTVELDNGFDDAAFRWELDSAGNYAAASAWCNESGAKGRATRIRRGSAGAEFIAGSFSGATDCDPGAGVDMHAAADGYDPFITRYNSAGAYSWTMVQTTNAGGGFNQFAYADMELTSTGNLVLLGVLPGGSTVDVDPGAAENLVTGTGFIGDFLWCSLTNAGAFSWSRNARLSESPDDEHLTIGADDHVLITSRIWDDQDFDGSAASHKCWAPTGGAAVAYLEADGSW